MIDSSLSFGLQKKSSLIFGTGKIGSIYPINAYEKIVTTNKEFVKIEDMLVIQLLLIFQQISLEFFI